ncbi:ATP synthase F0 subunit A [Paenibacillaceae bacterium]|nr:ATP synthase F0 subunit A [Paenibacillaceae bacterium]
MHHFPVVNFSGVGFDLSSLLAITVSALLVFVLARVAVTNLSLHNPSKLQNFMEWAVEFVHGMVASTMPLKHAKRFITLGLTLILFIFVSNLLGLPFGVVTEVKDDHHGAVTAFGMEIMSEAEYEKEHAAGKHVAFAWWKSPTADLSVTAGLAFTVFLIIHLAGLFTNTKHYIKHYFQPFPIFLPLNIIETISRPVTLAIRLFANIFAGEVLISTILMLNWVGIPLLAVWQGFSIFVGAIQAFLFTILTMVYLAGATVHEEHDDHAEHAGHEKH